MEGNRRKTVLSTAVDKTVLPHWNADQYRL
jgi:hypothetical protein